MNSIYFANNASDYKIMTWVLGNVCNYACTYCPEDLHAGNHRFPSLETATDIFFKFRGGENQKVYYEIVGGEPTLWPKLQEYINIISNDNTFIEVNSNGSRTKRYWDNFKSNVDFFYLSFHPENADEDKFIETIESLHERYRTHVTILLMPAYWDKCKRFFNKIFYDRTDLKINVTFTLVRPNFNGDPEPYTDEMTEYFNMKKKNRAIPLVKNIPHMLTHNGNLVNWRKFQLNKYNNFKGMHCNAPKERLYIHVNGDIYHAACMERGSIGNIYTGKYDLSNINPILCSKERCGCKFDALSSKNGNYLFKSIDISDTYDKNN